MTSLLQVEDLTVAFGDRDPVRARRLVRAWLPVNAWRSSANPAPARA